MPQEGFKDRIYYVAPETDEERDEREAEEEATRVEELTRSDYGANGRYYPGMERVLEKKDAERKTKEKTREEVLTVVKEAI